MYPIVIALVDIPLVFPDGRLPSPRFRWVTLASILLLIGWTIGATLKTDVISLIVLVSMLVSFVGAVIAVTLRFRRGDPVERQQVKGLAATVLVAGAFFPTGFLIFNANPELSNAVIGVGLLALFALPVVIGLAILRYRLYEIDRIISRTLAYSHRDRAAAAPCSSASSCCSSRSHRGGRQGSDLGRGVDAGRRCALPAGPPTGPADRGPALRPGPLRRRADHRGVRRATPIRPRPGVDQR